MKRQIPHQAKPKIVGSGLFALDLILDQQGKLLTYGLGGSAGNVVAILAKFGWDAVPVTQLGNDVAGRILVEEFTRLKADQSFIRMSPTCHTPVVYQHQLDADSGKTHEFSFACPRCGEKRSLIRGSTSLFETTLLHHEQPKVVYLDRATVLGVELAEFYRDQNVMIVFEPSEIGKDSILFQRALNAAHIVKYADDRLSDLASFNTKHVSVEVCTMGTKGLRYRAPSLGDDWVYLDAYRAPVIEDTAGAGDWCTAGMIQQLIAEGSSLRINAIKYNQLHKALRFGQALSALNCMTVGAQGLIRTLSVTEIKTMAKRLMNSRFKLDFKVSPEPHIANADMEALTPKKLRRNSKFSLSDDVCCRVLD